MLMSSIERKGNETMSNPVEMNTNDACCVTLERPVAKELFYVPQPTFIIPIFRAPTTTSTVKSITRTSTSPILTALLKQEQETPSTLSSNIISQRIFENLILTNTIVAALCIILMVTLTGFFIFLLIPSIRRRWINEKQKEERKMEDAPTISRQQSFQQFSLGPSRMNPVFEPAGTGATQFGQLFQIHPTLWTPMTSSPAVMSSPIPVRQTHTSAPVSTSTAMKSATTATTTAPISTANVAGRPPLPTHPPTTAQRSPRRRQPN